MSYNTEQRKAILNFLCANSDRQYSAEEIAQALGGEAGVSTVYRRLPELVAQGTVKRFTRTGTRKSVYQAVKGAHCAEHLHMKCVGCGRLLHMGDTVSEQIIELIKGESAFAVSEADTILYGICAQCEK